MEAVVERATAVRIFYGADSKEFPYDRNERVADLLARAVAAFGIVTNQHLMSLFNKKGAELPDESTLKDAKVRPNAHLVLRQSTVKGG